MQQYAQRNPETNQMIGGPRLLPDWWVTPEGSRINNFNSLPREVLFALHWVPVCRTTIDNPATHEHSQTPTYDPDERQFCYEIVARDIAVLKSEALAAIDRAAGDACGRYISHGIGQDMRYLTKNEQAQAFVTEYDNAGTPEPNPDDYPMVKSEAEAVGEAYIDRARLIVTLAAHWGLLAEQVEAARISGKAAVNAASTNQAVIEARNNAEIALGAI